MSSAVRYPEILRREGFQQIGHIQNQLHIEAWWNSAADRRMQILVVPMGDATLIKGEKAYYMRSVSAEGETWARDIGLLHDYLENHFPELRITFSFFRNLPPALAKAEVHRRLAIDAPTQSIPTVEEILQLQRNLDAKRREVRAVDDLISLSNNSADLLSGYVHQQRRSAEAEIGKLEAELEGRKDKLHLIQQLQREYERKGSAAVYCFSISSSLQVAERPERFPDALHAVVKELSNLHRYYVQQKLDGGRLNIRVFEASAPATAWIDQWFAGALAPTQLQRLTPVFDAVRSAASEHVIVTPDEPIVVDGSVRHGEKHLAARFVSTVLSRLDKTDAGGQKGVLDPDTITPEAMPLRLGLRLDDAGKPLGPAVLPLTQFVHAYISGTTGSGKSYLARAIVEEATQHKELSILVLDPRNQFVGLLVPEDRQPILQRYSEFGMQPEKAKGFDFRYFAPGLFYAPNLPQDLTSLATGRSIVSFKNLDDQRRCELAAQVLESAFTKLGQQESERPCLLILVDEAQLLTRKRVDESARDAAGQAERALDRIAREGRKYGIVMTLISQTIRDFSHELASLRQMTTTKIFLRNSDREIQYAADIIGDGRALVQLPTGMALVHNANWGAIRISVRPPYSKVYELPESQIRQLFTTPTVGKGISSEALALLAVIKQYSAPGQMPLNMSQLGELAGITSKRRLNELVDELQDCGAISTRKMPERGRPRIIELAEYADSSPISSSDKMGTKDAAPN